jgi:hypothetical protein
LTETTPRDKIQRKPPEQRVIMVAEMPQDEEMREKLDEMKQNDGYQGSCGV